jgi:hypothetical protein
MKKYLAYYPACRLFLIIALVFNNLHTIAQT